VYSTRLKAGRGLIGETQALLRLWSSGVSGPELSKIALQSGQFPGMSARRLEDIVTESFSSRFLVEDGIPAYCLRNLDGSLSRTELSQFLLLFTARANAVLGDFIRCVYWQRYAAGDSELSLDTAYAFVERAVDSGKTEKRWTESTMRRVAADVVGCCADFGMLESRAGTSRRFLPFRISTKLSAYLSYDLHFKDIGDNAILSHPDWGFFGLERSDILEEMKRLALKGFVIVQAAGDVVDISWRYADRETLYDALAER
jgi:hypothetical protein